MSRTTSSNDVRQQRPVSQVAKRNRMPSVFGESRTKLLLVDFRNDEAVSQHPDLAPFLEDGWAIESAVPRVVESEGTKLFVVLTRPRGIFRQPNAVFRFSRRKDR